MDIPARANRPGSTETAMMTFLVNIVVSTKWRRVPSLPRASRRKTRSDAAHRPAYCQIAVVADGWGSSGATKKWTTLRAVALK